jgi:Polyketide cyclase / dehydrase and lipid transport
MEKQRTSGAATANALKRDVEVRAEISSRAPAEAVYDVLADVTSHLRWAGEMQERKNHLLTIDAPEGPAGVGTEFSSTGVAPEGRYADRSVVTEASRPTTFEFVTQAHVVTKRGGGADLTIVSRYDIAPTSHGCRISSAVRTVRASALPGPLALMNVGFLAPLVRRESAAMVRRGLRNLAWVAEERARLS